MNCPPILHLAALVSLLRQPGLPFCPKHFLGIPLTSGAGGSGTLECAGPAEDVSKGLWCGPLRILPPPSPLPPQEEAQALRLPPTEFQPRGGALLPAAPGGEPCLGHWSSKAAQPQGGTCGGRAGPSPTPGLPVPSERWLPPARRARAARVWPESTRS